LITHINYYKFNQTNKVQYTDSHNIYDNTVTVLSKPIAFYHDYLLACIFNNKKNPRNITFILQRINFYMFMLFEISNLPYLFSMNFITGTPIIVTTTNSPIATSPIDNKSGN